MLGARVRNTKAVGELLTKNDEMRLLITNNVGHDGLPVYTTFYKGSEEAAGKLLAQLVWTLVQLQQSMAGILSIPDYVYSPYRPEQAGASQFFSLAWLARLTASFYEELRTVYMDVPGKSRKRAAQTEEPAMTSTSGGGQQNSFIPLPFFGLEIKTHGREDLQNALRMLETWMNAWNVREETFTDTLSFWKT
jgi:hypothetical protein